MIGEYARGSVACQLNSRSDIGVGVGPNDDIRRIAGADRPQRAERHRDRRPLHLRVARDDLLRSRGPRRTRISARPTGVSSTGCACRTTSPSASPTIPHPARAVELAVSRRRRRDGPRTTMAWGRAPGRSARSGSAAGSGAPSRPPSHPALAAQRKPSWPGSPAASTPTAASEPAPADDDSTLERQQLILEAFSEAFVGLRKGYEQFGAEVGVRTVNGETMLHRARNARRSSSTCSSARCPWRSEARSDRHLRRLRHPSHRDDGRRQRGGARVAPDPRSARQRPRPRRAVVLCLQIEGAMEEPTSNDSIRS